ncbi:uncharacterized protein LOC126972080 isoform X2 [Leptidea sinapis]|uniref:uncharacterized protein LOC126972080 isoform X2 n=1 Tax=Leptidea sinapis TaxID=189913 RepID=UPI0021C29381|nr:uncharacterized protein LOC126972080 isoform X2 [Leptidea sinapis]
MGLTFKITLSKDTFIPMNHERYEEKNCSFYTFPKQEAFKSNENNMICPKILTPIASISRASNDSLRCMVSSADVISTDCDTNKHVYPEMGFYLKQDTVTKLKDSTRKLIRIIEEIQAKTRKRPATIDGDTNSIATVIDENNTDHFPCDELKSLEYQTKMLQAICVEHEEDDCSIYKRLTRKCSCLNNEIFNDFVIHFNEKSKYTTNNLGEIVKNLHILKKFLYIGGEYTKNALMFLNQGLALSQYTEKVEIAQGCAHADICNIFEEYSIVTACISWPFVAEYYGDATSQLWTAQLLNKLAEIEEGRRYLRFNSKILNDIRKVLRKKGSNLDMNTVDALNATLNLLTPSFEKNADIKYFCKSAHEGIGNNTIKHLLEYRQYMTLDELRMHLELLKNFSKLEFGKEELSGILNVMLVLFRAIITDYNNSEINILITSTLNNILTKHVRRNVKANPIVTLRDTGTEAIEIKSPKMTKKHNKKYKRSNHKNGMGYSPVKDINMSKYSGWETSRSTVIKSRILPKDMKDEGKMRSPVIVVPMEK